MRVAMNFSLLTPYPLLLLVLWALGLSMVVLAALIHLPRRVLLAGSIAVILLHNTLDGVPAASFGALSVSGTSCISPACSSSPAFLCSRPTR